MKLTLGSATYELTTKSEIIENSLSILSILRTPVVIDGREISIAELIALANLDSSKEDILKKTLLQIIDESFNTFHCTIMCIDGKELRGNGCSSLNLYICPNDNVVIIPSYGDTHIKVSLESNIPLSDLRPAI